MYFVGEDWKRAMDSGSSPLHIVDPTGFEIQFLKSIVADDALLARLATNLSFLQLAMTSSNTSLTKVLIV